MLLSEVLITGFSLWLDARSTAGFKGIRQMDPFGTSLRGLNRVGGWLQQIRDKNRIDGVKERTRSQAYTDLKSMGLIVRPRLQDPYLTPLGRKVVSTWEALGIADNDLEPGKEIARGVALLRLGMNDADAEVREDYTGMYQAWLTLIRHQPADYWLGDFVVMLLPQYLDVADCRGYNPFEVLLAVNNGHLGFETDWDDLAADTNWSGHKELAAMLKKLRVDNRSGGSKAFRQALHVTYIARTHSAELPELLNDWNISQ